MNFLETTFPRSSTLKEAVGTVQHYSVILLKTFLFLGMMHTVPEHPTASTGSRLVCSRGGFAPIFAVTDVCPRKALMLLTVMYVPLTIGNAVDPMGACLSQRHMEVVC